MGSEYYIILEHEIDEFEVIPDIMKRYRCRMFYISNVSHHSFDIESQQSYATVHAMIHVETKSSSESLSESEEGAIHAILDHTLVRDNIKDYGWYPM